jgi:cytoskeletal protein CcmA (bactofilin family)
MKQKIMQIVDKIKLFLRHRKFNENRFDTLITKAKIYGDIDFPGQVIFDGCITGYLCGVGPNTSVVIKKDAVVDGSIKADFIIIEGCVRGDVTANEKLIIKKSANIDGKVAYRYISIEEGAVVNGSFIMIQTE